MLLDAGVVLSLGRGVSFGGDGAGRLRRLLGLVWSVELGRDAFHGEQARPSAVPRAVGVSGCVEGVRAGHVAEQADAGTGVESTETGDGVDESAHRFEGGDGVRGLADAVRCRTCRCDTRVRAKHDT